MLRTNFYCGQNSLDLGKINLLVKIDSSVINKNSDPVRKLFLLPFPRLSTVGGGSSSLLFLPMFLLCPGAGRALQGSICFSWGFPQTAALWGTSSCSMFWLSCSDICSGTWNTSSYCDLGVPSADSCSFCSLVFVGLLVGCFWCLVFFALPEYIFPEMLPACPAAGPLVPAVSGLLPQGPALQSLCCQHLATRTPCKGIYKACSSCHRNHCAALKLTEVRQWAGCGLLGCIKDACLQSPHPECDLLNRMETNPKLLEIKLKVVFTKEALCVFPSSLTKWKKEKGLSKKMT